MRHTTIVQLKRIIKHLTNLDDYEDAYYTMIGILKENNLYHSKYSQGCRCRKCKIRDIIENKIFEHFIGIKPSDLELKY